MRQLLLAPWPLFQHEYALLPVVVHDQVPVSPLDHHGCDQERSWNFETIRSTRCEGSSSQDPLEPLAVSCLYRAHLPRSDMSLHHIRSLKDTFPHGQDAPPPYRHESLIRRFGCALPNLWTPMRLRRPARTDFQLALVNLCLVRPTQLAPALHSQGTPLDLARPCPAPVSNQSAQKIRTRRYASLRAHASQPRSIDVRLRHRSMHRSSLSAYPPHLAQM